MNLAYLIALLVIVPGFLLASNTLVCHKDDEVWEFDPKKSKCDAAYLTAMVAVASVLLFLVVQRLFGRSADF
jgi:hypothetical protein